MAAQRSLVVSQIFADEGQSSETLDRPALQRLITDIEMNRVDRLIVYSIDRLTRRLIHLHTLLELFDKHDVELVVVTDPRRTMNLLCEIDDLFVSRRVLIELMPISRTAASFFSPGLSLRLSKTITDSSAIVPARSNARSLSPPSSFA